MLEITCYIADDGKIFTNKTACFKYELLDRLKNTTLRIVSRNGKPYSSSRLLEDEVYNKCVSVQVPDNKALEDLKEIYAFTGFYGGINSIGKWIYDSDECWVKK